VIHGDRDVLVPVAGARRFVQQLRAVSDAPVLYAELVGGQHAFEVFPSARAVRAVEAVERFLHHEHSKYLDARAVRGVPVPVAGA
jgi:dipeptidyl aminopeptidase/acylaminoacyl peptidase